MNEFGLYIKNKKQSTAKQKSLYIYIILLTFKFYGMCLVLNKLYKNKKT